ncbi:MAG: arsenate reductase (glutaredoxin) [Pseudomonadota bacterium]
MTIIWHNPRCSKSRQTLALLEERGLTPTIRKYLEDAPSEQELKAALAALGKTAVEITRVKDSGYKELADGVTTEDQHIALLAANPKYIERPIVFHDGKAALGRPPEAVLEIL